MVNICEYTLKIKHLPSCLTDAEKEDFMKHFGSQQVKVITSLSKQKSIVYGKFDSKQQAKAVLHRTHQLRVLDAIICVEYAEKKIADSFPAPLLLQTTEVQSHKHFINYVTKINALNSAVGYDQPPPAHLRYTYPRANRATIHNISFALETVPQFYVQVLHLMNRMNLPPPFSNAPDTPIPVKTVQPPKPVPPPKSDSESEMESEDDSNDKQKQIIPAKRQISQPKPIKRPKFIKPTQGNPANVKSSQSGATEKVAEVFEQSELKKSDKIELIVNPTCLDQINVKKELNTSIEVPECKPIDLKTDIITAEQLAANRVPLKDLYVLPIFKDYHPGTPNNKLYIKNIAKTVGLDDLQWIYKRYYPKRSESEPRSLFDIRLMTEGRMKGQAFVTLDSVELGQQAVKETNGFIVKDKPLVVVFAKIPALKKQ